MKKLIIIAAITLPGLLLTSCKKEKETQNPNPAPSSYSNGVFIIHEGNFTLGNSSVSFYNKASGALNNDLFHAVNDRDLGDVAQSMTVHGGKGYIVVNNSGKVEVVNMSDFKSAGVINIASPRYALGVSSSKVYITDWSGSGSIKVINTADLSISKSIPAGSGPEQMVMLNNKVYVANSGGYGADSTVTVVDAASDAVLATITVGSNPVSLKLDASNNLWVLCKGEYKDFADPNDDTPAELVKINTTTNLVERRIQLGSIGDHPQRLAASVDKNTLYYENFGIYKFGVADTAAPTQPFISKSFYGFDIDPATGIIYGADAKNFQVKGAVFRYNTSGSVIDSMETGIVPSGFTFN